VEHVSIYVCAPHSFVWAKSRRPSDLWRPARVGRRSAVVLLHFDELVDTLFVSLDQ
jgi:hypothetical protein